MKEASWLPQVDWGSGVVVRADSLSRWSPGVTRRPEYIGVVGVGVWGREGHTYHGFINPILTLCLGPRITEFEKPELYSLLSFYCSSFPLNMQPLRKEVHVIG